MNRNQQKKQTEQRVLVACSSQRRITVRRQLFFPIGISNCSLSDHDLCWQDAAYAERKHGNGKEAARYDAWMGFKGMVVIHSVNEDGAKAMKTYLRQARVAPFREV